MWIMELELWKCHFCNMPRLLNERDSQTDVFQSHISDVQLPPAGPLARLARARLQLGEFGSNPHCPEACGCLSFGFVPQQD